MIEIIILNWRVTVPALRTLFSSWTIGVPLFMFPHLSSEPLQMLTTIYHKGAELAWRCISTNPFILLHIKVIPDDSGSVAAIPQVEISVPLDIFFP